MTEPRDETPASKRLNRAILPRLLALARPEWRRLAIGTVCLALGSGLGLVFPQAMRVIIDSATKHQGTATIDRAALGLIALFLVQSVAISFRYYLFSTSGERVVTRLREQVFERLLQQEIAFFDERRTGELTNRLSSDTTVLQNTVSANISMLLRDLTTILGGLTLLLVTSPRLTLLMVAIVPAVALGAVSYGRRVRKLSREVQDSAAAANQVAEESISSVRTVRAFDAEASELKQYAGAVRNAFELARRRAFQAATFMGGASFAAFTSAASVLWYGGRLVMQGRMSVGGLTSFLIYTLMVAFALGSLSDLWADFMRASGASERIFELLDRVPAINSSGGLAPATVRGSVRFADVHFRYPSRADANVLSGIDLSLEPGEVVALVGPSGAGKSTLAALLARLYDPTGGEIFLDGVPLKDLDPHWLRRQVGSVAQEPVLFSTSIAENIRYARPEATDAEVEAAARIANAHDFVTLFPEGYKTRVGERGVQLSGGQKQRIAIARAVLKDPRILVLDEATSALDAENEHLVQEALERLMKGRTTLVIAHRLSTVAGASRVVVLEQGKVVQSGSHPSLMREEGLYRRLVERQFVRA